MLTLASLAWVLMWALGYPDQALHMSYESLRHATELSHPYMLAHGQYWTALLHQLRGEWHAMQELAESCMTLAKEQRFTTYRAYAMMECGAARAALGHGDEGIVQLKKGLAAARDTGSVLNSTYFLALLTEAYQTTGQVEQGLATLTEAQDIMDKTRERPYEAELYRLKGNLLLQLDGDHLAQAESSFHQALDVARRQHAKSWELRAATSLARLWQSQDKRKDAYDLLAPVYGWFTEGFDTADLIDAKQLLDELA